MKKILTFLGIIFLIVGCGKYDKSNLIDDLNKKINNSKSYKMNATLDIYRNEEKYTYDIESSYKKNDLFKVNLTNSSNNHEQIILKNKDGVYVLTPSLNKCFKFQSDWPYNNSQIYLLQPIISDITNDKDSTIEKVNNGYVITSKVNYSTEKDYVKQKVYVDGEKNITKVEVLDKSDNVKMNLNVIDIEYNVQYDDDYFNVDKYQTFDKSSNESEKENDSKKDDSVAKIDEIVYPMYVPTDTYLTSQDVVDTNSGERVILTFSGESSFTLIQENLNNADSNNYVYGDPYLILDTVGSITDKSVSWISNGIEYSVLSDTMNVDELLTVAQSISVKAVGK